MNLLRSASTLLACVLFTGCALLPGDPQSTGLDAATLAPPAPPPPSTTDSASTACPGTTALPTAMAGDFETVTDAALLAQALGAPGKGGLCQGQVYQSKPGARVTLYRAWNSTNPGSRLGNWWAASRPAGAVATYRGDYQICYQWSPLDMLVQCTLKPGTRIVVGTGQSATCSQYLSYPATPAQQFYVNAANADMVDCTTAQGEFQWR